MRAARRIGLGEVFKYRCIRCDYCCGTGPNVALTVFDVIRIAGYLGVYWRQVLESFTKVIIADQVPFISLRDTGDGRCIFLEGESGSTSCRIYPARPLRCRLYPLQVAYPGADYLYLDTKCPGVGEEGVGRVPVELYKHYSWELKTHYKLLYTKIFEDGMEPLEALYSILDELWSEYWRENPRWGDLKYIEGLGST